MFALIVSGFWVALASASEPDMLVANGSFDTGGRLQVAYSLAYSEDEGAVCNATAASPVTVEIDAPGSLRAEPSTLVFDDCDSHQDVVFTADSPGSHDVVAEIISGSAEGLKVSPGLIYLSVFGGSTGGTARAPGSAPDDTPPQWRCNPPAADDQWSGDNVLLTCSGWDEGSGLDLYSPAYFTLATSVAETEETSDADTGTETLCDVAGNCVLAGNLRGFNVDLRGPERIRIDGSIRDGDSFVWGAVPADDHTCTAADFGSGMSRCTVEGHTTDIGSHVLFAVASDRNGNWSYKNLFYDVDPWTLDFADGFSPDRATNLAPGAVASIPFEVFAGKKGENEQSAVSIVRNVSRRQVSCEFGFPISGAIPLPNGSVSRDSAGDRFVLVWNAPAAPSCHDISIDLVDGDRRTVRVAVGQ